jgi:hypothetical protein
MTAYLVKHSLDPRTCTNSPSHPTLLPHKHQRRALRHRLGVDCQTAHRLITPTFWPSTLGAATINSLRLAAYLRFSTTSDRRRCSIHHATCLSRGTT